MYPETSLRRSFSITDVFRAKGLRRKLVLTGVIVLVYQFLTHIPLPGLDLSAYQQVFTSSSGTGTLLMLLNLYSGGGLARLSILAVGLNAYIAAEAFLKFLLPLIPGLEGLAREDPRGFQNNIYPRLVDLVMLPLSIWLGYSIIHVSSGACWGQKALPAFGLNIDPVYTLTIFAILIGGAYLARWLASLIDTDGVGLGGVDILLLAGILAGLPGDVLALLSGQGLGWAALVIYLVLLILGVYAMIRFSKARRKVPVAFTRSISSLRQRSSSPQTYLPLSLMVGTEGIMTGQSLINLVLLVASLLLCSGSAAAQRAANWLFTALAPDSLAVLLIVVVVTIPMTYLFAMVKMSEQNYGENLRRSGGMIPGVRPGEATQRYLEKIMSRLLIVPMLFFCLLVSLPWVINRFLGVPLSIIDGDNLLFTVLTVSNILLIAETELLMTQYERGLIRG